MIKVTGHATLKVPYTVELDMAEEAFDALSEGEQDDEINSSIDWHEATRNADVDEIEVDDVEEK